MPVSSGATWQTEAVFNRHWDSCQRSKKFQAVGKMALLSLGALSSLSGSVTTFGQLKGTLLQFCPQSPSVPKSLLLVKIQDAL